MKNYPMEPNSPTPEQIIGDYMLTFKKHYKKAVKGEYASIPMEVREKVAKKWHILREAGWVCTGMDDHGNLKWRYITNSLHDVNREWEKKYGFDKMSAKEAKEWCKRNANREMFKSSSIDRPVEQWELEE